MYNSAPLPIHPKIPNLIALTIYLLKSVNHESGHYVIISIFPSLPSITSKYYLATFFYIAKQTHFYTINPY